jgi:hypothetical protein
VNPLKVVIWTCVCVFVVTALVTLLNMTGIWALPNPEHADSLFKALLLEIAVISVGSFGLYLKNELKSSPQNSQEKLHSENSAKTLVNEELTKPIINITEPGTNSIKCKNTDLLAVKGRSGIAVVKIENKPKGKANYSWRYKENSSSKELSGIGELYEQYGKININDFVEDVGGKLHLIVGPYKLEWSRGSDNSCWVYRQDDISLSIFDSIELDSFRF